MMIEYVRLIISRFLIISSACSDDIESSVLENSNATGKYETPGLDNMFGFYFG